MNWDIFDYNFDKTFYTLQTEKLEGKSLIVQGTFGGSFRVIYGSELLYLGKDREELDSAIAKLKKEINE